jgi:hypothetical protein
VLSRNVNAGSIAWSLVLALLLGILGILFAEFEMRADYLGEPNVCGLGNPPCSSVPISTHPSEVMLHPFAIVGAVLIGCSMICLLLCLVAWLRGRKGKVGWFGN